MRPDYTYIIGPTYEAWYGRVHEYGDRTHPKRPFARPALWNSRNRFPQLWRNMKLANTKAGRRLNASKKKGIWLDAIGVHEAVSEGQMDPMKKAALVVEREMKRLLSVGGAKRLRSTVTGRFRRVGTPSKPGEPPHAQTGNLRGSVQIAKTRKSILRLGG